MRESLIYFIITARDLLILYKDKLGEHLFIKYILCVNG